MVAERKELVGFDAHVLKKFAVWSCKVEFASRSRSEACFGTSQDVQHGKMQATGNSVATSRCKMVLIGLRLCHCWIVMGAGFSAAGDMKAAKRAVYRPIFSSL